MMEANFQFYCRCLYACFLLFYFTFSLPLCLSQPLPLARVGRLCICFCAFFSLFPFRFICRSSRKAQLVNDVSMFSFFFHFFLLFYFRFFSLLLFSILSPWFTHLLSHRFYLAKRLLISCIKMGEDIISAGTTPYKNTFGSFTRSTYTRTNITSPIPQWYKCNVYTNRNKNELAD